MVGTYWRWLLFDWLWGIKDVYNVTEFAVPSSHHRRALRFKCFGWLVVRRCLKHEFVTVVQ